MTMTMVTENTFENCDHLSPGDEYLVIHGILMDEYVLCWRCTRQLRKTKKGPWKIYGKNTYLTQVNTGVLDLLRKNKLELIKQYGEKDGKENLF